MYEGEPVSLQADSDVKEFKELVKVAGEQALKKFLASC